VYGAVLSRLSGVVKLQLFNLFIQMLELITGLPLFGRRIDDSRSYTIFRVILNKLLVLAY
jgi:hypothetical protein